MVPEFRETKSGVWIVRESTENLTRSICYVSLHNKKSDTKGYQCALTTGEHFGNCFFIVLEINVIYIVIG